MKERSKYLPSLEGNLCIAISLLSRKCPRCLRLLDSFSSEYASGTTSRERNYSVLPIWRSNLRTPTESVCLTASGLGS